MPGIEWEVALADPDAALRSFFGVAPSGIAKQDLPKPQALLDERSAMETTTAAATEIEHGKVCVLSIDGGGGMRGIIPARLLAHLEELLQKKSGDPDARIADFFDVVAGTSVGGVLATLLFAGDENSRPLFRAEAAWKLMAEHGRSVLKEAAAPRSVWSKLRRRSSAGLLSAKPLERLLQRVLHRPSAGAGGRALTLRDTLKPVLVPCYDLASAGPFLFSRAAALESPTWDFHLWEVCRATTAAPAVFPPARVASLDGRTVCTAVDGRVAMPNPAAAAVTHVLHNRREFPDAEGPADLLLLSLGTGQADRAYGYDAVRAWGALQWVKPVARIVLDGIADAVDHTISMAFGAHRSQYLRIQMANMPGRDPDDEAAGLLKLADALLDHKSMEHRPFGGRMPLPVSNRERLDWFADQLVQERKSRPLRASPTVTLKPPLVP